MIHSQASIGVPGVHRRLLIPCLLAITFAPWALAQGVNKTEMAEKVRAEFLHAWQAYKHYAWGHDTLLPLSLKPHDWYAGTILMTPVDSLDALILLGFKEEADSTRNYIAGHLSFDQDIFVSNFEITIRLLGGLLSGFQLTGDARLLKLAEDLGTRLLPAFNSPTGMPYVFVNLKTGKTREPNSNPAEIGTLLLEFGTLSKLTGKPVFHDRAKRALTELYKRRSAIGLVGEGINVETGAWTKRDSHVSGAIDSYYEYLLKAERLFGDADCGAMWKESLPAIQKYLADRSAKGLWYGHADMQTGRRTATQFGALDAFFPAVLALGGELGDARLLQKSAFDMWNVAGIEPEVYDYASGKIVNPGYVLRPEIIESAYYLYTFTQDPLYLQMGQTFFGGLVRYCRPDMAYAALRNVETKEKRDQMESFFLTETLKYLYLLYAPPETLNLKEYVLNTEAHPLKRTWK